MEKQPGSTNDLFCLFFRRLQSATTPPPPPTHTYNYTLTHTHLTDPHGLKIEKSGQHSEGYQTVIMLQKQRRKFCELRSRQICFASASSVRSQVFNSHVDESHKTRS